MPVRLTLVAAARSSSLLAERFDDDRPLDARPAGPWKGRPAPSLAPGAADLRYRSPSRAQPRDRRGAGLHPARPARAARLRHGPLARPDPRRGDGPEPGAVTLWLADPRAAPHGGESLLAFIPRIGGWLDTRPAEDGRHGRRSPTPRWSGPL